MLRVLIDFLYHSGKTLMKNKPKRSRKLRNFVRIWVQVAKTTQILNQSNLKHYMISISPNVHSKVYNHNLIFCTHDDDSYPKGLIVAFTLKNAVTEDKKETHESVDDSAKKVNGELDSSENATKENEQKADNEDEEKTSEGSTERGEEKEEKSAIAAYKDDMNVLMREDLKGIFKQFGSVKVP